MEKGNLDFLYRIAIITSSDDPASQNIKSALLSLVSFQKTENEFEGKPIFRKQYKIMPSQFNQIFSVEQALELTAQEFKQHPINNVDPEIKKQINSESGPISLDSAEGLLEFQDNMQITLNLDIISTDHSKIHLDTDLEKADLDFLNENYDFLIAASQHKSEAGQPALLVHCPGNFEAADAGGFPGKISMSCAVLQNFLYNNLILFNDKHNFNFPVDLEVTHHGPSIMKPPIVFIELGSSDKEYDDPVGGLVVAKSIILGSLMISSKPKGSNFGLIVCLGFGGMHYAANFSKRLETGFAFSHICSKHHVDNLTKEMVEQMVARTIEKPALCVLDWKSMKSAQKQKIISILQELNLPIARSSNL